MGACLLLAAACAVSPPPSTPPKREPRVRRPRTVADALHEYGPPVHERLEPLFARARADYPPQDIYLLAFKRERKVELWVDGRSGKPVFVRSYPILAASGKAGPKLREGDLQVPEGIYRILYLNPDSHYHLSMKINYPNRFDREMAKLDGRTDLGGDIFIHGENLSIGCIAVGNPAIEDLFVLVAESGVHNAEVVIAPRDLRKKPPPEVTKVELRWLPVLYRQITRELERFKIRAGRVRGAGR